MNETLGRYTLLKKLATGGMAEVFLAQAEGPGGFKKKCVVKRILPHFGDDQRFTEMFLHEAQLVAQLNHPNLVQIFDFGEASGRYYLAMEYIDGPNLRVLNSSARRRGGSRTRWPRASSRWRPRACTSRTSCGTSTAPSWTSSTATSAPTTSWSRATGR